MEFRNLIRPILTGLVVLGLIVLVTVLFIKTFSGNGSTPASVVDLSKYSNSNATATLLVDAPTNIDQDHRQIRISVSSTINEIDIIQGYQNTVINSQTYPSNSDAFGTFLESLKLVNFAKGTTKPADYRGYCPQGERYVYTFDDGTKNLFKYWSTTCHQGTYKGDVGATLSLFARQIPQIDFNRLAGPIPKGF